MVIVISNEIALFAVIIVNVILASFLRLSVDYVSNAIEKGSLGKQICRRLNWGERE